ncbi:hypothetical protein J2X66_000375 [Pseudomonas sp. 3296]|uniref:hypothetical protein n=1 Tax=Pseudomonas sp. 3296 TaxID=2817753 RepID=UPI0028626AC2|nr:hypothetical protein [Pseudomonas sp. 3296]MDR6913528.1 hypothetical protein [Pseudomonas sp. 3296]
MPKPILSLKKKPQTEEVPTNPPMIIEINIWDYIPEEEFVPRQRKRRKDRHIEQYRKDSRWQ